MSDAQEGLWQYHRLCERHGIPDGEDEVTWLEVQLRALKTLKQEREEARHLVRRLLNRYVRGMSEPGVTNDAFEALRLWNPEPLKCTHPSGLHCWDRGCRVITGWQGHGFTGPQLGEPCRTCADCDARREVKETP